MKRPKRTREQRAYDKVMRKLERLKRAAVRLAVADDPDDNDTYTMAVTDPVGQLSPTLCPFPALS